MSGFVLVRASDLRSALNSHFAADDGMGYFILWIMAKAETLGLNSSNVIHIKNSKAAKDLRTTSRTIIRWKHKLEVCGVLTKVKGQSLYLINRSLIFKGKYQKV